MPSVATKSSLISLLFMAVIIFRVEGSGANGLEPNFSPAQIRVLHELSDLLINEAEAEMESSVEMTRAFAPSIMDNRLQQQQQRMRHSGVSKRNSELLNSLLGLPKNILKSGRK